MNILICDDRPEEAKEFSDLLAASDSKINITVFENGYDLLDYVQTGIAIDVCFLDILMPEMSGVELAGSLRQAGFTGKIIFLSSSNEYAHQSYRVSAFDYLIKPPTTESVRDILDRIRQEKQKVDTKSILLKTSGVAKLVLFREISHVEVIQHKVYFRLRDGGEIDVNAAFGDIAPELLSDARFLQCHRSYIVNMDEIAEIARWEIVMRGGKKIPIARGFSGARNEYFNWKFGDEEK